VSFRDEPSQALARQIGLQERVRSFPDNVYSLDVSLPSAPPDTRNGRLSASLPCPGRFATLANTTGENLQALYDEYSPSSRRSPHRWSGTPVRSSCSAATPAPILPRSKTCAGFCGRSQDIDTPPYEPVDSVDGPLSRMAAMDYIVTCRFHGVVLAHILNKPVLAISHHPKVTDLMAALGLSHTVSTSEPSTRIGWPMLLPPWSTIRGKSNQHGCELGGLQSPGRCSVRSAVSSSERKNEAGVRRASHNSAVVGATPK